MKIKDILKKVYLNIENDIYYPTKHLFQHRADTLPNKIHCHTQERVKNLLTNISHLLAENQIVDKEKDILNALLRAFNTTNKYFIINKRILIFNLFVITACLAYSASIITYLSVALALKSTYFLKPHNTLPFSALIILIFSIILLPIITFVLIKQQKLENGFIDYCASKDINKEISNINRKASFANDDIQEPLYKRLETALCSKDVKLSKKSNGTKNTLFAICSICLFSSLTLCIVNCIFFAMSSLRRNIIFGVVTGLMSLVFLGLFIAISIKLDTDIKESVFHKVLYDKIDITVSSCYQQYSPYCTTLKEILLSNIQASENVKQ